MHASWRSLSALLFAFSEDGVEGLVSSLDDLEVYLTGILGDCVATEVTAHAQSVWLVTETLLFAAFGLVDQIVALESG